MTDTCTISITPPFTKCNVFDAIAAGDYRIDYDTAIIFATGPNVLQALSRLPMIPAYHLGVNGAIDLPIHLHSRVVIDANGWHICSWGKRKRHGTLELHSNAITDSLSDMQFMTHVNSPYLRWKSITAECTVSGAALSLLYWLYKYHGKPSRVLLAGVDMGGGRYFNGYTTQTPGPWSQRHTMQKLLAECAEGGLIVQTLSDTLLDIEHA